jgi:hypothetical protein
MPKAIQDAAYGFVTTKQGFKSSPISHLNGRIPVCIVLRFHTGGIYALTLG